MDARSPQPPRHRRRRSLLSTRPAALLVALVALVGLAGCSSARADKAVRVDAEHLSQATTTSLASSSTPSTSATTTSTTAPRPPAPPPPFLLPVPPGPPTVQGVFAIGDSVMLGAAGPLRSRGVQVDAVESRQWGTGIAVLSQMARSGRLPPTVVVHLGTNGAISAAQFDATMRVLAGHHVVFLTVHEPRSWQGEVNDTLHAGVARWPGARLLDWDAYSVFHPEWFWADRIHLRPDGAQAYAALVAAAI